LKGATTGTNNAQEHEDEVEVDINLLPEKEKNKIIKQREREAQKAKDKEDREAKKDKEEREAKKRIEKRVGERGGKSKVVVAPSFPLLLIEASIATPSQNPRKRDASIGQLSMSRLQQITSPALMDSAKGALHVQEFLFSGSFLSTDAYFADHKAFPKEWVDMKAFLEKVFLFSC
jgi:hypothetical protein